MTDPNQAAVSIGLLIPLYYARRRAGSPQEVVSTVASTSSATSPAALLGRHTKPKTVSTNPSTAPLPPRPLPHPTSVKAVEAQIEANHNTALYTFGAFGLATAAVWAGAGIGVYAIHRATGATTVSVVSVPSCRPLIVHLALSLENSQYMHEPG